MEQINYTVISNQEYKGLLEDIINKENCIKELNKVNQKENKRNNIFENLFLEKLLKENEYYLENMKDANVTDYYYQELFAKFLEIGIDDIEYIDLKINQLKNQFDKKITKKI